jgi:hypothetical protein
MNKFEQYFEMAKKANRKKNFKVKYPTEESIKDEIPTNKEFYNFILSNVDAGKWNAVASGVRVTKSTFKIKEGVWEYEGYIILDKIPGVKY